MKYFVKTDTDLFLSLCYSYIGVYQGEEAVGRGQGGVGVGGAGARQGGARRHRLQAGVQLRRPEGGFRHYKLTKRKKGSKKEQK